MSRVIVRLIICDFRMAISDMSLHPLTRMRQPLFENALHQTWGQASDLPATVGNSIWEASTQDASSLSATCSLCSTMDWATSTDGRGRIIEETFRMYFLTDYSFRRFSAREKKFAEKALEWRVNPAKFKEKGLLALGIINCSCQNSRFEIRIDNCRGTDMMSSRALLLIPHLCSPNCILRMLPLSNWSSGLRMQPRIISSASSNLWIPALVLLLNINGNLLSTKVRAPYVVIMPQFVCNG